MAGAAALRLDRSYYSEFREDYRRRRSVFLPYLAPAGFAFAEPQGAYYVIADASAFGVEDDVAFARTLTINYGVAAVPGSTFYSPPQPGRTKVRFMFAKKEETLHEAGRRLLKVRELAAGFRP
jgi:aminotransferase